MLKIYNTLSRRKEPFKPFSSELVRMYVCGPTVYDFAHIGHAKTYVHFDVVVRYLRSRGYAVRYIQNITDIGHLEHDADDGDDKILKRARERRVHPMELAETFMREHFRDMDALGVLRPDISPRASGHIPEIIKLIKQLIERGIAYEVNGSVYFDVSKFPRYGVLSGRDMLAAEAGTRVAVNHEKRNPIDFALWKRARESQVVVWQSPWGRGYPGWHIECSAMSMKYLGKMIDIHGGAVEIAFPHHENEIAQSESVTGKQFVRYWMHGGVVRVHGEKMSKSLGNVVTIRSLLKSFDPETIRFFIVSRHYRQPIDFDESLVTEAEKNVAYLRDTFGRLEEGSDGCPSNGELSKELCASLKEHDEHFGRAMDDDFNTPVAAASLLDVAKEVNRFLDAGKMSSTDMRAVKAWLQEFDAVLGIFGNNWSGSGSEDVHMPLFLPTETAILIGKREQARREKDWEIADKIRSKLAEKGIVVEDMKGGVRWKRGIGKEGKIVK